MHKHQPTNQHTHTLLFPRRLQCVGGVRTIKTREGKQQQNFTIPTKIFCRVQESMQDNGTAEENGVKESNQEGERERENKAGDRVEKKGREKRAVRARKALKQHRRC